MLRSTDGNAAGSRGSRGPRGPSRFRTRFALRRDAPVVHRLVMGHCTPWPGGWPLPAAGGRRHAATVSPDHACFLQSVQKAKRSRPFRVSFASITDRSGTARSHRPISALTGANRRASPAIRSSPACPLPLG